jgi:hypothetical protein
MLDAPGARRLRCGVRHDMRFRDPLFTSVFLGVKTEKMFQYFTSHSEDGIRFLSYAGLGEFDFDCVIPGYFGQTVTDLARVLNPESPLVDLIGLREALASYTKGWNCVVALTECAYKVGGAFPEVVAGFDFLGAFRSDSPPSRIRTRIVV